jgi:hypothetical protein
MEEGMSRYKLRPDWRDVLNQIIKTGWCTPFGCVLTAKGICPFCKLLTGISCPLNFKEPEENKQLAKQRMEELEMQENTPKSTDSPNGLKRGDRCWVSDGSEEDAREEKRERTFLGYFEEANPTYRNYARYNDGNCSAWTYAIPVEEEPVAELTIAEIAEKFGIPADKLRIKE